VTATYFLLCERHHSITKTKLTIEQQKTHARACGLDILEDGSICKSSGTGSNVGTTVITPRSNLDETENTPRASQNPEAVTGEDGEAEDGEQIGSMRIAGLKTPRGESKRQREARAAAGGPDGVVSVEIGGKKHTVKAETAALMSTMPSIRR
ncbi:hypothetical protein KIPB_013607, partial [Kipferlia bialata]